jgi:hypothetical protein
MGQFHVDTLKDSFSDFARANLYSIEFQTNVGDGKLVSMLCKNVTIPAYNVGKFEMMRMGERLHIPSKRELGEVQVTILCDNNFSQRKFLTDWIDTNVYSVIPNNIKSLSEVYNSSITITQLNNVFNPIVEYKYIKAFPTSIGEIQFGFESDAQITEFPAIFCFSEVEITHYEG